MADLSFVHIHHNDNVGDQACSPKHYFDFPEFETNGFGMDLSDKNTVVYGGGQIFNQMSKSFLLKASEVKHKVVWGVGISAKQARSIEFDLMAAQSPLISSRNVGIKGCEFVPCASAMSPLFDHDYTVEHPVVLFSHGEKSQGLVRPDGVPELSNLGPSMAEAIAFMGSGEVVVTNSFHGTYWAMCLGKRVLCVPFSDKFMNFVDNPITASPEDWPEAVNRAEQRLGVLEEARAKNQLFYEKCKDAGAF